LVVAALVVAGCGSTESASTASAPSVPTASLHLNTGNYSTNAPVATLSGTATEGSQIEVTETSPSQGGCGQGNSTVTLKPSPVVHHTRWSTHVALFLEECGEAFHDSITGANTVVVRASHPGMAASEEKIIITRTQNHAEKEAKAARELHKTEAEQANPNSALSKEEATTEAEIKAKENKAKEEERPYKEAEESRKNLEAKQAEEHVKEEEAREQRRLESEGK
jgi:hypothetical protein